MSESGGGDDEHKKRWYASKISNAARCINVDEKEKLPTYVNVNMPGLLHEFPVTLS